MLLPTEPIYIFTTLNKLLALQLSNPGMSGHLITAGTQRVAEDGCSLHRWQQPPERTLWNSTASFVQRSAEADHDRFSEMTEIILNSTEELGTSCHVHHLYHIDI
jgi:hypothetical protein